MKKKLTQLLKKLAAVSLVLFVGTQVFAQNRIELAPNSKGIKISESTFKGFESTFSFSAIEATPVKTEAGDFSVIKMDKTMMGAEQIGGPSLPIARELVAVPFGATPVVKVLGYTTEDYKLDEYGIKRVYPQQPSYSKSTKQEDMLFHYDEKAYQTRDLATAPEVTLEVLGTMRGVQLGALQVEPVSYNPATNTLRVYNDIELEVVFENADIAYTEEQLIRTYSPYFDVVYKQLFNNRAITDVYDDHPDLYKTPVRMLVIANRMFENVMQPWLEWKTQKGFYVDLKFTDEIGTTSNEIKTYIYEQYEENAPSFVIMFGDRAQVAPSSNSGTYTSKVTDLYYATVDGDHYPDMYHSRMCCETVEQMTSLINKTLQVEQYTMPDPSYLNNVLLIAGADGYWNPVVGQPTIEYASHYYYNEENGFENVYKYLSSYSGCYNHLSTGVGFVNYTAHGGETSWSDPQFTTSNAYDLSNMNKYFWAMGNCCLAADWGYSSPSLGEVLIRGLEKGAWGYIGSCPLTYWWEDYYFGVGATNVTNRMPTTEETTMGNYDGLWMEDTYNVLSAVPFVGNLAVAYAHTSGGYETSISVPYYFEAYHTLGDGSVMPYRNQPTANNVSHLPTLPIGMDFYTVSAAPGSYVGISKDGTLYGAGMIDETGTTNIPMTPILDGGEVTIVVTHPTRIPYVKTVVAAPMEGAFVAVNAYEPSVAPVNQDVLLSVIYKNVGVEETSGPISVKLSCDNADVTLIDDEATIAVLGVDETADLTDEFSFRISENLTNGDKFFINSVATCGSETWESKMQITVATPIIEFKEFIWPGVYEPGETYSVMVEFNNVGGYKATNTVVTASSQSEYISFAESEFNLGTIETGGVGIAVFDVIIDASCPSTEVHELLFDLQADNGITAQGSGTLKNTCDVVFKLKDDYGDGWNGASLVVSFDDGTPNQTLTLTSGSQIEHILPIGANVNVAVTFQTGVYNFECSIEIYYKDGEQIYSGVYGNGTDGTFPVGQVCSFVCNCGSFISNEEFNPVQNLQATVIENNVTLTWNAPRSLQNYIVLRDGIELTQTTETTYVDENVTDGTHTYSVIAVYEEGTSVPQSTIVTVGGESIEDNTEILFSIYPNPAKDEINIVSTASKFDYQLINNLGQVVVSGTSNGLKTINVSDMNKGVYFLKVVADGEVSVNRVVIQ